MNLRTERLEFVEVCKGFAIFLVVFGHIVKSGTSWSPDWYEFIKGMVYKFHMPLFMGLSGYLFFYVDAPAKAMKNYSEFLKKRFARLLLPFFVFAFSVFFAKLIMSLWFDVDEKPRGLSSLLNVFVFNTESSPVFYLWYLVALFFISLIVPVLLKYTSALIVFLLSLIVYFFSIPDVFYINRVFWFLPFFMMGGLFFKYEQVFFRNQKIVFWFSMLLFLMGLYFFERQPWGYLICGGFSIPAALVLAKNANSDSKVYESLSHFGKNSMVIYLLHVPLVGVLKILYPSVMFSSSISIVFVIFSLTAIGLYVPIFIKNVIGRLNYSFVYRMIA